MIRTATIAVGPGKGTGAVITDNFDTYQMIKAEDTTLFVTCVRCAGPEEAVSKANYIRHTYDLIAFPVRLEPDTDDYTVVIPEIGLVPPGYGEVLEQWHRVQDRAAVKGFAECAKPRT